MLDVNVCSICTIAVLCDEKPQILASIVRLKSELSDIIEPDCGLLDELLSLKVLTVRQCVEIRSATTVYLRNDALLDLLTSEEQSVKFLTALERTGQQHIVHLIRHNGGQRDDDFYHLTIL